MARNLRRVAMSEALDKLAFVSKIMLDKRVIEQRQEIEAHKHIVNAMRREHLLSHTIYLTALVRAEGGSSVSFVFFLGECPGVFSPRVEVNLRTERESNGEMTETLHEWWEPGLEQMDAFRKRLRSKDITWLVSECDEAHIYLSQVDEERVSTIGDLVLKRSRHTKSATAAPLGGDDAVRSALRFISSAEESGVEEW
jgi:hypothetical protein